MSSTEVLQRVTAALGSAGVPYMLTGSFASVFYGSPRSTQDIDFVIEASEAQLHALASNLPHDQYYVDVDAALEALRRKSLFNIIDLNAGWKIDMIIRKSRAFSREEFGRRQPVTLGGVHLFVATAEDIILSKLEWSKLSESQRQIDDAAGILRLQGSTLDRTYLDKWIGELGLAKQWSDAQRTAKS
jgi:hypothetical protein